VCVLKQGQKIFTSPGIQMEKLTAELNSTQHLGIPKNLEIELKSNPVVIHL